MAHLRSLGFHAEKLHDDAVWRRVKRICHWLELKDIRATFFVYPFRAQVAGADITERVQTLASWGHEIGQHTHFYQDRKIDKPDKTNDLSSENIDRCLRRDFDTLRKMGLSPKGFTAGAWLVNEVVWDALVSLGFLYDCSVRFSRPKQTEAMSMSRWRHASQFYTNPHGRILCMPTTCSVGEWFKWGRKVQVESARSYQLVYLHDYDLLSASIYMMMRLLLQSFRGACRAHDVYAEQIESGRGQDENLSSRRATETGLQRERLR